MPELDHHPEPVSLHDCSVCQDRGIEVESREYCQACYRGKRRKNMDSFADKLRGLPFTDAMWIVAHSTINTERAIAAAELALLKSKLLQAERELAEVRKDSVRYKWLANRVLACDYGDNDSEITGWRIMGDICDDFPFMYGSSIDNAIDAEIAAASVAQANKEPKE